MFHPFQAMPEELSLSYIEGPGGQVSTVIALFWPEGAPAACQLCPLGYCGAGSGRLCQRTVPGRVAPEDAWLHRVESVAPGVAPLADDPRLARPGPVGPVMSATI